jgi:hypothetical protein
MAAEPVKGGVTVRGAADGFVQEIVVSYACNAPRTVSTGQGALRTTC